MDRWGGYPWARVLPTSRAAAERTTSTCDRAAFAYLLGDGLLLAVALAGSLVMLAVAAVAVWEALSTTGWVPGLL
jgi:hypothetical protein